MVIPSRSLPSILQDEGEYTRIPVSYDNIWLSYMYGIDDLKRITEKNTKTMIKLNSEDSPYLKSNRLFNMFKLLPIGQVINAKEDKLKKVKKSKSCASPTRKKWISCALNITPSVILKMHLITKQR